MSVRDVLSYQMLVNDSAQETTRDRFGNDSEER